MKLYSLVSLYSTRVPRIKSMGKEQSLINGTGTTGYLYEKKWSKTAYLTTSIKTNLKWITDLSVRAKSTKFLEK